MTRTIETVLETMALFTGATFLLAGIVNGRADLAAYGGAMLIGLAVIRAGRSKS
jgi:hypothetical protein